MNLYHVIALKPRQQLCLRLLVQEAYLKFIERHLNDLRNRHTDAAIDTKLELLSSAFDKYNQVIDLLANRSTLSKAEPKVLTFAPVIMKSIVIAVEYYDDKSNSLSEQDRDLVEVELPNLKLLVTLCKEYTYTNEEISKMKRSV